MAVDAAFKQRIAGSKCTPSLLDLPSELCEQILQYLPLYDQMFVFGEISRRFNAIAIQHHSMRRNGCVPREAVFEHKVGLLSHPSITTDFKSLVCAMDYQSLMVWDASRDASSKMHTQSVSYDTSVQPLLNGQHLILWTWSRFCIFEPFRGDSANPLYQQARAGKKDFIISRSNKFLACKVHNFDHSFMELFDLSGGEIKSIQQWPCGLVDLDFGPDDNACVYVSYDGEVVLHGMEDERPLTFRDMEGGIAVRFSPNGNSIAVAKSNRTVTLFDHQLVPVVALGDPSSGRVYCHKLIFSEDDDLLLLHTEDKDSQTSEHKIQIWALPSCKILLSKVIKSRKISNLKIIAMLPYLHGILILINGVLECWIFPQNGIATFQPVYSMRASIEEEIMSSAVSLLNPHTVAVGRKDGSVTILPLPFPIDLLKKQNPHWAREIRPVEAWRVSSDD